MRNVKTSHSNSMYGNVRYFLLITRENCTKVTLREPYQDKVHREKCLLPTPEQSPISTDSSQSPSPDIPPGLDVQSTDSNTGTVVLGGSSPAQRKKRNKIFDQEEVVQFVEKVREINLSLV